MSEAHDAAGPHELLGTYDVLVLEDSAGAQRAQRAQQSLQLPAGGRAQGGSLRPL